MDGHHPNVSVVIPLYNKADVVQATLACVLAQTFRASEVIVVDDGSSDKGGSLVQAVADPRVRLISQANQGESAARNRGILEARGEWIALIDADDLWASNHMEGLASAIKDPGVIGAFSNILFESTGRPAVPLTVPSQRVDDYFSFALTSGGYAMTSSSVLLERRQLIDCGLFAVGKPVGADVDMWCRIALRGSLRYVANASARYRDTLDSSALARNLKKEAPYPLFAARLPNMISRGEVPSHLITSARRYANFLMLEYARQLLDLGEYVRAREVLIRDCKPSWDTKRYLRRLLRTWSFGRWGYHLSRRVRAG